MDYMMQVTSLPKRGETIFAVSHSTAAGGKGANQAVAAARLGSRVYMVGRVGSDEAGRVLVESLERAGVDASKVGKDVMESTGSAYITVDRDGANTIVVNRGANFAIKPSHVTAAESLIQEADVVVVQLETPIEVVFQALRLARKHGAVTVLNPAPMAPLKGEMLALADWLIPNETEAFSLLRSLGLSREPNGKIVKGRDPAIDVARRLANVTGSNVVVTFGDKGCAYAGPLDREGIAFPAYEVDAIDTTGAGDTFVGALACVLDESLGGSIDIATLIAHAQAAAAISTTSLGAQTSMPIRTEVEEFLAERGGGSGHGRQRG
jgi:ribokinase